MFMTHQTKWLIKLAVLTPQSGGTLADQFDASAPNHKMVKFKVENLIPQPMPLHLRWLRVTIRVCKPNPMAAL